MASPGSVDSKQLHDPQEEKCITNQHERVNYLFRELRWKGGRRAFEVWETDGGNVPAEEKVYLVNGVLKKGFFGWLQWKIVTLWKRVKTFFTASAHHHQTQQQQVQS